MRMAAAEFLAWVIRRNAGGGTSPEEARTVGGRKSPLAVAHTRALKVNPEFAATVSGDFRRPLCPWGTAVPRLTYVARTGEAGKLHGG